MLHLGKCMGDGMLLTLCPSQGIYEKTCRPVSPVPPSASVGGVDTVSDYKVADFISASVSYHIFQLLTSQISWKIVPVVFP